MRVTRQAALWMATVLPTVLGHWEVQESGVLDASNMHLLPPQNLSLEARFQCSRAPLGKEEECFGPRQGGCPNGTRCLIKNNHRTKKVYATCCCSRAHTPIDMVYREHWSCFASEVASEQSHGERPYCDVLCCNRPQVSRACHGNGPICCDEEVSTCGISLHGKACCASKDLSAQKDCCTSKGSTCLFRSSWLTDAFVLTGQPCCHQDDGKRPMTKLCFEETRCTAGLPSPAFWVNLVCGVVAAVVQVLWCRSGLHWCTNLEKLRQALRFVVPLALLYLLALATAMLDLQDTRLPFTELFLLSAASMLYTFLCSLPLTCLMRFARRCRLRRAGRTRPRDSSAPANIAVLINIQEYEHLDHVVDRSWPALCAEMRRRSQEAEFQWEVLVWPELKGRNVRSLVDLVRRKLEGTSNARVLIYISCHSQMMNGVPQFLPADAAGWGDGVCLSWLVRQLDAVQPRHAHFYIMVNGCLTNASRVDRCCWAAQQVMDDEVDAAMLSERILRRRSDPQVWMLFACPPGGQIPGDEDTGDHLTRLFLEALRKRPPPAQLEIEEIYNELHEGLWKLKRDQGGPLQPYLMVTTGKLPTPIPRQASDESQQTCASALTQSTEASSSCP